MPRAAKGTVRYIPAKPGEPQGHYFARISLTDGTRAPIHFDPGPKSKVAETSARHTAEGWTERARRERLTAADFGIKKRGARSTAAPVRTADDMAEWLKTWLADRTRKDIGTRENASHWEHHIQPVLGGKHIAQWEAADLRALVASLDRKIEAGEMKSKTAQNIWATCTAMCRDAKKSKVEALRVRDDNPATDIAPPERGVVTAKQYLYPSEALTFLSCARVPLKWRRGVALAVYLYPRLGELRVLAWEDVDLQHGTIHIHQALDRDTGLTKATKTDHARRFNIEPALLPLLKAMHHEADGKGLVCSLPSERDMARGLRRWLFKANVKRAELHTASPTRKAMTWYDLRATGATWMAVRGDDPLKIGQRLGHSPKDHSTTLGYIRTAEAIREGFGDVFPPLPASLVAGDSDEDSQPSNRLAKRLGPQVLANYSILQRGGRDSNPRPPA